jgi:rhodanese-related sulfurtransferase
MGTDASLEVTPQEVHERRSKGESLRIIDVREPQEYAISRLSDTELIPLRSIPDFLNYLEGLSHEGDLMILCHHGLRSLHVAAWLRERGIRNCASIAGGIDQWSCEIDASIPRY